MKADLIGAWVAFEFCGELVFGRVMFHDVHDRWLVIPDDYSGQYVVPLSAMSLLDEPLVTRGLIQIARGNADV